MEPGDRGQGALLEAPRRRDQPDQGAPTQRVRAEQRVAEAPHTRNRQRAAPEQEGQDEPRRGFPRHHPLIAAFGLLALLLLAAAGYFYWDYAGHFETTNDAFIAARSFPIAPKVSGYITDVPVTDNQHVVTGEVIARIDPGDYRAALDQADAQVASAQAGIQNVEAQTSVQQAQIAADRAQVVQAQAGLVFAQQQATRYQALAHSGAGSVQSAQQYSSELRQAQAALDSAQANLAVSERKIESLNAQHASAVASLAQARAQREQAQLNLSYTTLRAAQPGHVVNLSGAVGEFAQAGTNIAMLVPDQIWITANFKETQLDHMRPGQPVTIRIDAYRDHAIQGHVASIQPGSGTAFSLLPPENATGNWVKVVQRVPVKIVMDNPPRGVALGPGMSVEVDVRVNPRASLYERIARWL
jgi:membrane fusion protein (multidrug efflux system)